MLAYCDRGGAAVVTGRVRLLMAKVRTWVAIATGLICKTQPNYQ